MFANNLAIKFIDPDGLYSMVYYSEHSFSGMTDTLADSIKAPTGQATYLFYSRYNGTENSYIMLDSIKTKGMSGASQCVKYIYEEISFTTGILDTVSFVWDEALATTYDYEFSQPTRYVLKKVIYPSVYDTLYYDYNTRGELSGISSSTGAQTQYGYGLYSFSMYPTDVSTFSQLGYELTDTSYTRAVDTVRVRESASAPFKTTLYQRTSSAGRSNPSSCDIQDPHGNRMVHTFQYSVLNPLGQFKPGYGMYLSTTAYDADDNTIYCTSNSYIPANGGANTRLDTIVTTIGNKKFVTRYCDYDTFCNPRRIEYEGDASTDADDRYEYFDYLHDNKFIDLSVTGPSFIRNTYSGTININYSSGTGVVQTKLYRNGSLVNTDPFPPSASGTTTYIWNTTGVSEGLYYFYSVAYDVAGNAVRTDSISIEVCADPGQGSESSTVTAYVANQYGENNRHMLDLASRQWDSIPGGPKLSETIYKYDEYGRIDSTLYDGDAPLMWDDPHFTVRGLPTTVKTWKAGALYDSVRMYYDQCGNVIKAINPKGDSSKVYYAPSADPDKYQYALPCSTVSYTTVGSYTIPLFNTTEYDTFTGIALKSCGANRDTTRYEYDNWGRLLKVFRPGEGDSAAIKKHYYDNGYPRAVVDSTRVTGASFAASKIYYDGFGRVIQTQKRETDGKATIINTQYDSVGQVRRVSNPIATTTTFGTYVTTDYWSNQPSVKHYYDGAGRPIKTVYQDSTRDSVAYGDNWVKTWDAAGDTAIARTNGPGMADTTVNGLGLLTIVKRNKMGQDSVIIDASGKSTYCYYDTLGRIKGTNGPDASSSYTYKGQNVDGLLEYDQLGNITSSKNAKAVINYTYDPLTRISRLDSADTDKVLYKYDSYYDCNYDPADTMNAKGRLTRLITAGIDTTWMVYDKLGRTIKTVYTLAGMAGGRDSIRYVYNAAGACTSMIYPDGTNIRYTYNAIGQLTGVPNYIYTVSYNANGTIKKISNVNSTNDSLFYNNLFKLTRIKTSYYEDEPPSQARMDLRYTFWADGNIKKVEDYLNTSYTQYFDYTTPNNSYDAAGRLQRCAVGSNVLTYSYDNVGNRTQETIAGTTNSLSYTSGTDKLSSATINGTSYNYTHDDVGNITQKTWGMDNGNYYSYNYANLLTQVSLNGSRTVTNYYGGGGATRVKKTDSQLGSRYYGPLSEHDSTGAVKKKYIFALGRCIAFVDSASNTHWLHQDAQGSTKLITNASGTAENAYKYYPFGDSLNFTGTVKNDVKYTGQRYVDGIESYDFNARYYDPELGRFYSIDPLGSAAISPYAYCSNDPVNFIDPSGMVAAPIDPDISGMADGGFNGQAVEMNEWFGGNIYITGYHGVGYLDFALFNGSMKSWNYSTGLASQVYNGEYVSEKMFEAARMEPHIRTEPVKGLKTDINNEWKTTHWFNVIDFSINEFTPEEPTPGFNLIIYDGYRTSNEGDPYKDIEQLNKFTNSTNENERNQARGYLNNDWMIREPRFVLRPILPE